MALAVFWPPAPVEIGSKVVLAFDGAAAPAGMNVHRHARTTPHRRRPVAVRLHEGWTAGVAAAALGIGPETLRGVAPSTAKPS